MQSDPFAQLRHLIGADPAAPDTSAGDPADLFAGSEPAPAVPATPTSAAPVVDPAGLIVPDGHTSITAPDPASVSLDQLAGLIVDLDQRIAALEQLARRNGWPL